MDSIGEYYDEILKTCGPEGGVLFVIFIALSALTTLNMLIGFQCETVSKVAAAEHEANAKFALTRNLHEILDVYCEDLEYHSVSAEEFRLLMEDPDMYRCLSTFGTNLVDPKVRECLTSMVAQAYDDIEERSLEGEEARIDFQDFLAMLIRLRDANAASVHDMVVLQEDVRECFGKLRDDTHLPRSTLMSWSLSAPDVSMVDHVWGTNPRFGQRKAKCQHRAGPQHALQHTRGSLSQCETSALAAPSGSANGESCGTMAPRSKPTGLGDEVALKVDSNTPSLPHPGSSAPKLDVPGEGASLQICTPSKTAMPKEGAEDDHIRSTSTPVLKAEPFGEQVHSSASAPTLGLEHMGDQVHSNSSTPAPKVEQEV
jgi:hypothetical protein